MKSASLTILRSAPGICAFAGHRTFLLLAQKKSMQKKRAVLSAEPRFPLLARCFKGLWRGFSEHFVLGAPLKQRRFRLRRNQSLQTGLPRGRHTLPLMRVSRPAAQVGYLLVRVSGSATRRHQVSRPEYFAS